MVLMIRRNLAFMSIILSFRKIKFVTCYSYVSIWLTYKTLYQVFQIKFCFKAEFFTSYLKRRLQIFSAEQKLQRVPLNDVLKDSNPFLHQGLRVGHQVVRLIGRRDLERVGPVRPAHPAAVLQDDQALRLPVCVMLKK